MLVIEKALLLGVLCWLNKLGAMAGLRNKPAALNTILNTASIQRALAQFSARRTRTRAHQAENLQQKCPPLKTKIIVNGKRNGWRRDLDKGVAFRFSKTFLREPKIRRAATKPAANVLHLGHDGDPKAAVHNHSAR